MRLAFALMLLMAAACAHAQVDGPEAEAAAQIAAIFPDEAFDSPGEGVSFSKTPEQRAAFDDELIEAVAAAEAAAAAPEPSISAETRAVAEAEVLACVRRVAAGFAPVSARQHVAKWGPHGRAFARCVSGAKLAAFGTMAEIEGKKEHDNREFCRSFRKALPKHLLYQGLAALLSSKGSGLPVVKTVLAAYMLGANPNDPDSCNSWVAAVIADMTSLSSSEEIKAAAEKLAAFLITNQFQSLGSCLPDVPAIMLSVLSTYCPNKQVDGSGLYLAGLTFKKCAVYTGDRYENNAAPLLFGSVVTFLLNSKKVEFNIVAMQVAFAMARFTIAIQRYSSFLGCTNAVGGLSAALEGVPKQSAVFTWKGQTLRLTTPIPLGPDGRRVLCATVGILTAKPTPPVVGLLNYEPSVIAQGYVNVINAISAAVDEVAEDDHEAAKWSRFYCKVLRRVLTFDSINPGKRVQDFYTNVRPNVPAGPYGCWWQRGSNAGNCNIPGWVGGAYPTLAAGHDLSAASAFGCDNTP